MTTVRIYCDGSDRDGQPTHDPIDILVTEVPLPETGWFFGKVRSSVLELTCERSEGGCGRSPRPGDERLRQVLTALADTPSRSLNLSTTRLLG